LPHPPAYCPNCKSIFPARAIEISGGAQIGISNILTNCPVCGFENARVSEGVFKATNDAIELITGPSTSRAMLESLREIAQKVQSKKITQEQALAEAKTISPTAVTLLEKFFTFGIPALALLISIISVHLQNEGNKSSSIDSEKLYGVVTEQIYSLKNIEKHLQKISREQSIQNKSARPTNPKSATETPTIKKKSNRRAKMKQERRENLKKRWSELGRSRTH
jgi:hypothetical protein